MKYMGVSDKGEFVTITIDPIEKMPEPISVPKPNVPSGHRLKVEENGTDVSCSCGAIGYICTKCKKVMCSELNPSPDEKHCRACYVIIKSAEIAQPQG